MKKHTLSHMLCNSHMRPSCWSRDAAAAVCWHEKKHSHTHEAHLAIEAFSRVEGMQLLQFEGSSDHEG
jgi:hypothetical protein